MKLPQWSIIILSFLLVVGTWILAENAKGDFTLPAVAIAAVGTVMQIVKAILGLTSNSVATNQAIARASLKIGAVLAIAFILVMVAGCQVAIPQPGQTPAQVQACTNDAVAHNFLAGGAGVLAGAAGIESTVATQVDPTAAKALAIGAAVTAGLGAASVGASALFAQAYNNDGCAPSLAGRPSSYMVTAPVSELALRRPRFEELGWKPGARSDP